MLQGHTIGLTVLDVCDLVSNSPSKLANEFKWPDVRWILNQQTTIYNDRCGPPIRYASVGITVRSFHADSTAKLSDAIWLGRLINKK
jgi:hypothetical protein